MVLDMEAERYILWYTSLYFSTYIFRNINVSVSRFFVVLFRKTTPACAE